VVYLPGLFEELLEILFKAGFGEITGMAGDLARGVAGLEFGDGG
jgi:hypothetical protein